MQKVSSFCLNDGHYKGQNGFVRLGPIRVMCAVWPIVYTKI